MEKIGIAASEGIAIAKVFELKETTVTVNAKLITDVAKAHRELAEAVLKTVKQIEAVKARAAHNLGADELAVFDAHIQLVSDPVMLDEIKALVSQKHYNLIYSTKTILDQYYETFMNLDDAYMRERAADIKDIAKRLINNLAHVTNLDLSAINEAVIVVADDLTPSDTAQLNKQYVQGFATNIGGKTSHSAIMARSLEIPAVLGLKTITTAVKTGDLLILDGLKGIVIVNPKASEIKKYEALQAQLQVTQKALTQFVGKATKTADGKTIELAANIGSLHDLDGVIKNDAEAIGLFRSEFLYMDADHWPTEAEQLTAYKTILIRMKGRKTVVRTLDIGGDKTLKYFKFPPELNPFLGYRAIRLTLDKRDVFETQLRALIRASQYGKLAIMFPMIATIDEFKTAKAIFTKLHTELRAANSKIAAKIEVGMMVEIPAAAINAAKFAKYADFFSIGTNDLMQYTMAADRMNEKVAYLYQPLNPAILELIKMTIDGAHRASKWVGMCGEMASDPSVVPFLLGLGLDEFSVSASSVLKTRQLIAQLSFKKMQQLAALALTKEQTSEVQELLKEFKN